jgi:PAS domain-containing protein
MRDRIQTTVRFPESLYHEFADRVADLGENMNAVLQRLAAEWLDNLDRGSEHHVGRKDASLPSRTQLLKDFVRCLPAACAIKIQGRVVFANPEFRRLVGGGNDLIGALPIDYWPDQDAARQIMACDRIAQDRAVPILCADHLHVRNPGPRTQDRLTIRFPIFDRAQERVEAVGVVGFDLRLLQDTAQSLEAGQCQIFEADHSGNLLEGIAISDSLLIAFIDSLPGIATVKAPDSHLLTVNRQYTILTGKSPREVLGHRPIENWPNEIGALIERHDREVIARKASVMSVESIPTKHRGIQERMNMRFPIFDGKKASSNPTGIGTIGFDFGVIKKGMDLLNGPGGALHVYVFLAPEKPSSLKALSVHG